MTIRSPLLQKIAGNAYLSWCSDWNDITFRVDKLCFDMGLDFADSLDPFDDRICRRSLERYRAVETKSFFFLKKKRSCADTLYAPSLR